MLEIRRDAYLVEPAGPLTATAVAAAVLSIAVPAGTQEVRFRGQQWWGGSWMVRDASIWSPSGSGSHASMWPSSMTVQAPQTPTLHASFVPVSPMS